VSCDTYTGALHTHLGTQGQDGGSRLQRLLACCGDNVEHALADAARIEHLRGSRPGGWGTRASSGGHTQGHTSTPLCCEVLWQLNGRPARDLSSKLSAHATGEPRARVHNR